MKKTMAFVLVLLLVLSIFNVVYSSLGNKTITATYRNISIYVNGKKVTPEIEPFIYNGRTLVPLRFVSEALNKEVTWDDKTSRININDKGTVITTGGLEEATLVKDFDGDKVIIERVNGEKWILEAKTWCSWSWRYEGSKVLLKFGYVTSILINDDGDTCEFWTGEEI
jgi:hypothetical protein